MTERTYGWGIIGVGAIAGNFAQGLATLPQARLIGVAARSKARAEGFAQTHGGQQGFEGAEALISDPNIDIVYIASPGALHRDHAVKAMRAGKAVLVEKPLATNVADARAIAQVAQDTERFCMEAMWMRFHPLIQRLKTIADEGQLGRPLHLAAEAGYRTAEARLADRDPARGAILNFGCYGASLAHHLFGAPDEIRASVQVADGLGRGFNAILHYDGFDATIAGSVAGTLANRASLTFEHGRLEVEAPFFNPPSMDEIPIAEPSATTSPEGRAAQWLGRLPGGKAAAASRLVKIARGQRRFRPVPAGTNALAAEAAEVMACLDQGHHESDVMPLTQSVAVIETLETIANSTPG